MDGPPRTIVCCHERSPQEYNMVSLGGPFIDGTPMDGDHHVTEMDGPPTPAYYNEGAVL